ncbi:hypothetical protein V6N13_126781 [Hibiscus sabdariffa]
MPIPSDEQHSKEDQEQLGILHDRFGDESPSRARLSWSTPGEFAFEVLGSRCNAGHSQIALDKSGLSSQVVRLGSSCKSLGQPVGSFAGLGRRVGLVQEGFGRLSKKND